MRQIIFIIIFAVAALGAVVFSYRFLTRGPDLTVSAGDGGRELKLAEYRKIKTLRFDPSMFSDPFLRLLSRPTSQEAPEEAAGRENPFLPTP